MSTLANDDDAQVTLKILKVSRFSKTLLVITGIIISTNIPKSHQIPLRSRAHCRFPASPSMNLDSHEKNLANSSPTNPNPCLLKCSLVKLPTNSPLTSSGAIVLDGKGAELVVEVAPNPLAPKRERHAVFAKWLAETLNLNVHDRKSNTHRVIDVAGGKRGLLSFALAEFPLCMPCTVVDPAAADDLPVTLPPDGENPLVTFSPTTIETYLESQKPKEKDTGQQQTKLIFVGMHPDQATDAIVDEALAQRAPFALCPCCVFPQVFVDRRQSDGKNVSSYGGLLRYLRQKDPRIRVAELGFVGRDTCVFMLPEDYDIPLKGNGKSWKDDAWWDEFRVGATTGDDLLHVEDEDEDDNEADAEENTLN